MTTNHDRPTLWVFAGPNGAGKTSLFNQVLRGKIDFINADEIAREIAQVSGSIDVIRAGRLAIERRNRALASKVNLSIETTLSGNSAIMFMRHAKQVGYKIDLAYVGLDSADLSAERVEQRVALGGHDVPSDAISRRYPASMSNLETAIRLSDRAFIFDNSGEEGRLLLIIEDQMARWIEKDFPGWLEKSIPQEFRQFQNRTEPGAEGVEIT